MSEPGWYADPFGRYEYRWFDGQDWTDAVRTGDTAGTDPATATPAVTPAASPAAPVATAPAGGERPARVRPVRWLVVGGLVVVAAAIAVWLLSDSGGSDIDADATVEALLEDAPYGASGVSVDCGDATVEEGSSFECEATGADDTTIDVEVDVESTEGEGEFDIENVVHVGEIESDCQEELTDLLEGAGLGSCELVDCPDLVEAMPNGTLECRFEESDGQGGTIVIPLGEDGVTAEGPWEATEE